MKRDPQPTNDLWDAVKRAEPTLDDVAKARILAGVKAQLMRDADERPHDHADEPRWRVHHTDADDRDVTDESDHDDGDDEIERFLARRRRRAWRIAGGLALVGAAAALLLVWSATRLSPPSPGTVASAALQIEPYRCQTSARCSVDPPSPVLDVAAGALVRARVGAHTLLTLHGPARLVVEDIPAGQPGAPITLHLDSGLLIAEYSRAATRRLAVETDDAVVTITGTVFAVAANADQATQVAVERGSVQVADRRGDQRSLSAGQAWRVGAAAVSAIPARLGARFDDHNQAPGPSIDAAEPLHAASPGATEHGDGGPGARASDHSAAADRRRDQQAAQGAGASPEDRRPTAPPTETPSPAARARAGDGSGSGARSAEQVYRAAEDAIARGERPRARALLDQLVREHPGDELVDVALYELGRMEFEAGDLAAARAHLERVIARQRDPVFLEPASYLRCRVILAGSPRARAITCLTRFRRDYPDSPHDPEALALVAALHHAQGDCDAAVPLLSRYLALYPDGPFADEAKERMRRCQ